MLLNTKKRELTEEENQFKIALSMAGIGGEDKTIVWANKIWKGVQEKGEDFSLRDAVAIEIEVKSLYPDFPSVAKEKETEKEAVTDEQVKSSI